jgi:hypothetical protein
VDARNKALANALVRPFDDTPDTSEAAREMAARLVSRDQAASQAWRSGMAEALSESWPAELAKSAYGAVTLPGDVYAGKVNPMSDEAVGRAFELAGLVTGGAGAMPAGRNEMRMGIKAYHGSPHDFDRFDMSKIGTGEGAQAYGHGLYFAEKEGIAKSYRDALSAHMIGGKPVNYSAADDLAASWFTAMNDRGKAADYLQRQIENPPKSMPNLRSPEEIVSMKQAIDILRSDRPIGRTAPSGRMYEVELNTTPDRLLDWDKPLSGQSDAVRRALEPMFGAKAAELPGQEIYKKAAGFDPMVNVARKSGQGAADILPAVFPDATQSQIQQALRAAASTRPGDDVASNMLRERGIDGIKYLDAGSRAAGDGSRNYVMFDDKLISILRKYGVATAAALPAAALAELGLTQKEAERTF